jgi:uncharacterized membrane protein
MVYFQNFVSAMVVTALIVIIARFVLSIFFVEMKTYIPSLCVGFGFMLGHYSVSGPIDDPATATATAMAKFLGSAICLIVLAAGFRYRTNVA